MISHPSAPKLAHISHNELPPQNNKNKKNDQVKVAFLLIAFSNLYYCTTFSVPSKIAGAFLLNNKFLV
jgi:hypothetical protein